MEKDQLKQLLKENLRFKVEEKCLGHMAPTKTWLTVLFDGEIIDKVEIKHEECSGEWGE